MKQKFRLPRPVSLDWRLCQHDAPIKRNTLYLKKERCATRQGSASHVESATTDSAVISDCLFFFCAVEVAGEGEGEGEGERKEGAEGAEAEPFLWSACEFGLFFGVICAHCGVVHVC